MSAPNSIGALRTIGVIGEISRHSAVYGLGIVFSRVGSLILLPLYTRYLTPADYGTMALLDLSAGAMAILIGAGLAQAVNRFHFLAKNDNERTAVWWTGLLMLAANAAVITLFLWVLREPLTSLALPTAHGDREWYVALVILTLWTNSVTGLLEAFICVLKWSGVYLALSAGRLLTNAALNIFFLTTWNDPVAAVLTGNLVTGALFFLAMLTLFVSHHPRVRWSTATAKRLLRFGAPLLLSGLLTMLMHQSDRYLLSHYLPLATVGVYSLAYQLSQGANSLLLIPFGAVWAPTQFELEPHPDSRAIYRHVFHVFTSVLMFTLAAISVLAPTIVGVLAAPSYADAALFVPVICLAYFLFSLTTFVSLPATIHSRTVYDIPGSLIAFVVCIGGNLLLLPHLGGFGAAVTAVFTFGTRAAIAGVLSRRIEVIPLALGSVMQRLAIVSMLVLTATLAMRWLPGTYIRYAVQALAVAGCGIASFTWFLRHHEVAETLRRLFLSASQRTLLL